MPIKEAVPIEQSSKPVKKEAIKMNWLIFGVLTIFLVFPGIFYFAWVAYLNRGMDNNGSQADAVSQEGSEESLVFQEEEARALPEHQEEIAIDEPYHTEIFLQLESTLASDIQAVKKSNNTVVEQTKVWLDRKVTLQDEAAQHRDALQVRKKRLFLLRPFFAGDEESVILKKLEEINEEVRDLDARAEQLAIEVEINSLQHPEFTKVSNSGKGFPFRLYFAGEELQQEVRYAEQMMLPGTNNQFNTTMNKTLMSWSGVSKMDPLTMSIPAQAQEVLVQLSRRLDEPFAIRPEELKKFQSGTIMVQSTRVSFEAEQKLVIEHVVQTRDGQKYKWVETIQFSENAQPVVVRHVTKM